MNEMVLLFQEALWLLQLYVVDTGMVYIYCWTCQSFFLIRASKSYLSTHKKVFVEKLPST